MAETVEVSVIIPCYRAGDVLPRFVSDLKAQDFAGTWEAIFVADGEAEGETLAAVLDDPRFRLVVRPHRGVSAARNAGLEAARGEIVLFADADDQLAPAWMSNLAKAIDGVDVAWGGFRLRTAECETLQLPEDAGAVYRGAAVRRRIWRAVFGYRVRDILRWGTRKRLWRGCRREFGTVWCRAFRRTALADVRFDETLALNEDALFLAACAQKLGSLRILGDTGYVYVAGDSGAVARETRQRLVANKFLLRDARAKLDPQMTHWRGTFLLSAVEVARAAGWRAAVRYLLFKPFDNTSTRSSS